MKKLFKSIVATMLVAVLAITAFGTDTAQAAETPVIKITFNKKTVKFKVNDDGFLKETSYKTLKKKWGKASITQEDDEMMNYHFTEWRWEKGESAVWYGKDTFGSGNYYGIDIKDKNASICGVKTGTKTNKAKKAFKKAGATVEMSNKDTMRVKFSDYCSGTCSIKNGKVSNIKFELYHDQSK